MSVELWATVGTIIGTLVLVVVPGLAYTWAVLDDWVDGPDRYPDV
jgi:hypothetical protein